jgi:hypothetical protein
MSNKAIICPHCHRELSAFLAPVGHTMECPLCYKKFVVPSSTGSSMTTSNSFPAVPTPDGYNSGMILVVIYRIIGVIITIYGLFKLADDGWAGLSIIATGLFCLLGAGILRLFCGIAQNTAYQTAMKEYELKKRE